MREKEEDRNVREECLEVIVSAVTGNDYGYHDARNQDAANAALEVWRKNPPWTEGLLYKFRSARLAVDSKYGTAVLEAEAAYQTATDENDEAAEAALAKINEARMNALDAAGREALDPLIKATRAALAPAT